MPTARGRRDERGETLVELVVALAILGIAGVAILAGLMLSVKTSTVHRNEATGGAYVRSFAEAIQQHVDVNGYASCGSAAGTYGAVAVTSFPAGYTKAVTSVQKWDGSAWVACTAGDDGSGIQRVDLVVTSTGDAQHQAAETLTVILREPCNGAATASGDDPCS